MVPAPGWFLIAWACPGKGIALCFLAQTTHSLPQKPAPARRIGRTRDPKDHSRLRPIRLLSTLRVSPAPRHMFVQIGFVWLTSKPLPARSINARSATGRHRSMKSTLHCHGCQPFCQRILLCYWANSRRTSKQEESSHATRERAKQRSRNQHWLIDIVKRELLYLCVYVGTYHICICIFRREVTPRFELTSSASNDNCERKSATILGTSVSMWKRLHG